MTTANWLLIVGLVFLYLLVTKRVLPITYNFFYYLFDRPERISPKIAAWLWLPLILPLTVSIILCLIVKASIAVTDGAPLKIEMLPEKAGDLGHDIKLLVEY